MITSAQNSRIQWVRKLQAQSKFRRSENAFVVEGVRLCEESLAAAWPASLVLHTADLGERGLKVADGLAALGATVELVSPEVMKAASDTETPQGLLAVLALRPLPLPPQPDFVLIPDGVRDPGNLGTILRTAAAASVQAVLLPPGSADPYAPKVLRSAMGAHFRLPVHSLDWEALRTYLNPPQPALAPAVFLADAAGGQPYTQADLRRPLALVIGGEAAGAGAEMAALAQTRLHIPMPGGADTGRPVESLNAAVAAAILMFEVVRQRSL